MISDLPPRRRWRTALFWVVTQRVVVISYRRFGTTSFPSSGSVIDVILKTEKVSKAAGEKWKVGHNTIFWSLTQFKQNFKMIVTKIGMYRNVDKHFDVLLTVHLSIILVINLFGAGIIIFLILAHPVYKM